MTSHRHILHTWRNCELPRLQVLGIPYFRGFQHRTTWNFQCSSFLGLVSFAARIYLLQGPEKSYIGRSGLENTHNIVAIMQE